MIYGFTTGLKPSQLHLLESLPRRRNPPDVLFGPTLAALLVELARDTGREVGVLVDRRGAVRQVVVGTSENLPLPAPDLPEGGLRPGLRLLHAHPGLRPLSPEDCTCLFSHRLDAIAGKINPASGLFWDCQEKGRGHDRGWWVGLSPEAHYAYTQGHAC